MTASQHRLQPNVAAPRASRRRAAVILTAAAAVVLALVVGLVAVLVPSTPTAAPLPGPAPAAPGAGGDGWDLAGQTELATRPMPSLPDGAALPQPLSADSAGPPIRLPSPDSRTGLVPRGFPPTAEGALAQLAALTAAGLVNADPQAYAAAYTAVAAPGAPAVEATPLHRGLVEIRARSGLRTTGAVPGLRFSWTPGGGLIKGSTDRGRYVVACVIGQLDSGAHGQILSTGAGDCQALRFADGQWWISPGAAAAAAPLAWPGSAAAAQVGYRAVTDAA